MNQLAVGRYFSLLASFFTEKKVSVAVVDDAIHVGYTMAPKKDEASIVLSYSHPIYGNLSEDKVQFLMMGVLVHECLHQIYTNFSASELISKRLEGKLKKLFLTVENIAEDAAIEYAAPAKFGGTMLRALNAMIAHTYKQAPPIDQDVPPGMEEAYALTQVLNALIQIGDKGVYKGEFSSELATDAWNKVLPLFNKCVLEPKGSKRSEISLQITKLLEPLLALQNEAAEQMADKLRGNKSQSAGSGTGEDIPDDPSDEEGKEKQKNRESSENGSSSSTPDSDTNGTDTAPAGDVGDGDDGMSERDLEEIKKGIEKAQEDLEAEKKAEEARAKAESESVLPCDNHLVTRKVDVQATCISEYTAIAAEYRQKSRTLSAELRRIFSGDYGGKKNSSKGNKMNLRRVASPILHSDVMVARTAPKDLSSVAVCLLVDESGSMREARNGAPNYLHARRVAISLYEALKPLGIPLSVLGFTTGEKRAINNQYVGWNSPERQKYALAQIYASHANFDFWSIEGATRMLQERKEKHKILIVVSDGAPCGAIYAGISDPQAATRKSIENARKQASVLGVALNPYEPDEYREMYGKDFITVSTADDVFLHISSALKKIVRSW